MSTRFYYLSHSLFWVNPKVSPIWQVTGQYDLVGMTTGKTVSTETGKFFQNKFVTGSTYNRILNRVYISPLLKTNHVLSGTVKGQLLCWQDNSTGTMSPVVRINVVDNSGNFKRILFNYIPSNNDNQYISNSPASGQNRYFPITGNIGSYSASALDCITVEIGTRCINGNTGCGAHYFGNCHLTDLPENNTFFGSGAGWIEFSDNIPV